MSIYINNCKNTKCHKNMVVGGTHMKMYATDDNYINEEAKYMCIFYKQLYLRMKSWFGFSYPCWLSNMDESNLLKNILRINVPNTMHLLFINVAIRIRKKYEKTCDLLQTYKDNNSNPLKSQTKKQYYLNNIEKFKQYSKNHYLLKNSKINIFKKNVS